MLTKVVVVVPKVTSPYIKYYDRVEPSTESVGHQIYGWFCVFKYPFPYQGLRVLPKKFLSYNSNYVTAVLVLLRNGKSSTPFVTLRFTPRRSPVVSSPTLRLLDPGPAHLRH